MIEEIRDKKNRKIKMNDKCVWINTIGDEKTGVFKGIEGPSKRQAGFLPDGEEKIIYVDVAQLMKKV